MEDIYGSVGKNVRTEEWREKKKYIRFHFGKNGFLGVLGAVFLQKETDDS